ncbi:Cytochrome P450 4V3 [Camponotus floridanus]|uniref:Cytochrome P450 4V3 n=1 Tax=Camponotus floridanus TaxID=104421 RepID=E2AB26_CAMFO|nr:Cytochrome P450 4V3 [Camponotus floridanus]
MLQQKNGLNIQSDTALLNVTRMDLISLILYTLFVVLIIPAIIWISYHQYVLRQKFKNIPVYGRFPFSTTWELLTLTSYDRVKWYIQRMLQFKEGIFVHWIGMNPFINLYKPELLEIIMSSTVNIAKGHPYKMMESWLGKGLLTSTRKQWFHDRKLIGPTFHFSILDQFAVVMSEKAEILIKCLEKEIAKNPEKAIDIFPFANNAALDVICETAMGVNVHAQEGEIKYTATIHRGSELIMERFYRPWLWSDWFYNLTSTGKKYRSVINIIHKFTREVCAKKGHDTTAVAITWTLFLLGNNLEHQEKVHEELEEVFKDSETPATVKELSQLKYLDRIIKETLRLFPSVPLITRKLAEDVKIGDYTFPKGITVILAILLVHLNPEIWPDPKKFDPDRFLPENSKHRNPYAYIPFSAGPRNCIGRRFALLEEKMLLTAILRKWRVKSIKKPDTVEYGANLIFRPSEDIFIHFTPKK